MAYAWTPWSSADPTFDPNDTKVVVSLPAAKTLTTVVSIHRLQEQPQPPDTQTAAMFFLPNEEMDRNILRYLILEHKIPKSLNRGSKGPTKTTQNNRMTKMRSAFWNMLGQAIDREYDLKARGMTHRTVPLLVRMPDGNGHLVKCKSRLNRDGEEKVEDGKEALMVEKFGLNKAVTEDDDHEMLPLGRPLQVSADFDLVAFIWSSAQGSILR